MFKIPEKLMPLSRFHWYCMPVMFRHTCKKKKKKENHQTNKTNQPTKTKATKKKKEFAN
jgi:hypothetical protein